MENILLEDAIKEELKLISSDIKAKQNGTYRLPGLPSGIGIERLVPGGIPYGVVSVLCGDTGVGKSTTLDNISDAVSKDGNYVLRFSLEDSTQLTAQRGLSRHTGIPFERILTRDLTGDDLRLIADFSSEAAEAVKRVIVIDIGGLSIDEIIKEDERIRAKYDVRLTAVDYLQVLQDILHDERAGLKKVMLKLQHRAKATGTAWMALSQLNREGLKNREDPVPRKYDLYGASAIEQCSKLVVGMHRPSLHGDPIKNRHYDDESNYPRGPRWWNRVEAWVLKNVRGPIDKYLEIQCDFKTGKMIPE